MRALHTTLLVLVLGISATLTVSTPASANQCAVKALNEAKAALGNQSELNRLYDKYFGEHLARQPVARRWNFMTEAQRTAQIMHARRVVISLASKFAPYAAATFRWQGNTATFRLGKQTGRITVTMAGSGCKMSNVCIAGFGCLASSISDYSKLANR